MKLPSLLTVETSQKDEVLLIFEVSSESEVFNGHFPENPILPGVVQIDWALRFAALHLGLTKIGARDFRVKYSNIIRPNVPLSLKLRIDHVKQQLSFIYMSDDKVMSSGTLKLGTPI